MELLDNLAIGFATAFTLGNILYCFIGVLLGTMVRVLPGLGPIATIAMLLPLTFALPPVSALIMLSGIYYGSTIRRFHHRHLGQLAWKFKSGGHGARRLSDGVGAPDKRRDRRLGSFFAGSVATLVIALAAPPLADLALRFGPADYFSLMVLGLSLQLRLRAAPLRKPSSWCSLA